jgi:hypothetical protein
MRSFLPAALLSILVLPTISLAQKSGFDFLRTSVGARPSSMADAFVAMPGDIHNLVYNPAGLATLNKRQATLTYLNHLLDFQSGFLAYVQPIRGGGFGLALHFFDYGQFEGKDESNQDTGDFGASGLSFSATYAREVVEHLSIGASGKFIRFQIEELSSSAFAGDVGLIYSFPAQAVNVGLGVFNVGTTSAFIDTKEDLPTNLQLGASKQLAHLPLLVSGALVKFIDESIDFRLGGEFQLSEQLFLRFGYNSVGQDQKVNTSKDRLAGVSLGLGFAVSTFNFDYSFSSFGEVGSLNRITLVGQF